ncbi:hypothetical protein BT96DRAFT_1003472 [Gymnopus androsaceus JB14]|uniref:Uncharacterized protein n=1 Tax=Gymnopus androsaceus JB14 TaxID=1447944 RepID=A0A6A4GV14_9AGAR|nr:hypothetical protein BT96DRAFT_1003472 [Gymnopus androsaceus JB14]
MERPTFPSEKLVSVDGVEDSVPGLDTLPCMDVPDGGPAAWSTLIGAILLFWVTRNLPIQKIYPCLAFPDRYVNAFGVYEGKRAFSSQWLSLTTLQISLFANT